MLEVNWFVFWSGPIARFGGCRRVERWDCTETRRRSWKIGRLSRWDDGGWMDRVGGRVT